MSPMRKLIESFRRDLKKPLAILVSLLKYLWKGSTTSWLVASLTIVSIISFSFLIVSHFEYKLINGDSKVVQNSSESILDGEEFYFNYDLEAKVNNFRKTILESDSKWVKPDTYVDIEIFLESVDRIDEVAKTIHMKGYMTANYFKSSIKTPYLSSGSRTLSVKEDVLDLATLNFSDVEKQYFKRLSLNTQPTIDPDTGEKDTLVSSRYAFAGEFPLQRDLSKFPFETAQWQIKLRVPLSAAAVWLSIDNDNFNFPNFDVDAYYFADPGCNEYLDLVCVIDEVVSKGEKVDADTLQWHIDEFDEPPYNADGITTVEEANAWKVIDYEPVIGVEGILRRSIGSSFFRFVFPVIAVCSLLILFEGVNNKKYLDLKLGAPPTVFLTLIFMQSGYQSQLPQIAYITYLDKIYIVGYMLSVISLARSILLARLDSKTSDRDFRITRIRKKLKWGFYIVLILGPWLAWIC